MVNTGQDDGRLPAIEFSNLRVQVVRALREGIVLGRIPQGSKLVESQLATQLRVSRGTVREALLELQQEQLVEVTPKGRLRVREIDSDKVIQLFVVRGALEGLAAELIASSEDRAPKRERLRAMLKDLPRKQDGAVLDLIDADLGFHRHYCELSENDVLLHTWDTLVGPLRVAIMHAGEERAMSNISVESHEPFIGALGDGVADPGGMVRDALNETAKTLVAARRGEQVEED